MTLAQMLTAAQELQDELGQGTTKRGLRTTEEEQPTMAQLMAQIQELKLDREARQSVKAVAEPDPRFEELMAKVNAIDQALKDGTLVKAPAATPQPRMFDRERHADRGARPREARPRHQQMTCWNCGDVGHVRVDCPKETVGSGFTHWTPRPGRNRNQRRQQRHPAASKQTEDLNQ